MICIDTNVLIWGVQGVSSDGQSKQIDKTRRFLKSAADQNEKIMLPADVVSEYLAGFPPERQEEQLEIISRNFYVAPYDARCAAIAAQISAVEAKTVRRAGQRNVLKSDIKIVATAIAADAKCIVTHNVKEFKRLAGTRIQVIDIPEVWEQGDFVNDVIRLQGEARK